jgi:hypothetical protein
LNLFISLSVNPGCCDVILQVNHSCLAIAGASLFTSISFNLVNVLYQLSLATELAHFGSSA